MSDPYAWMERTTAAIDGCMANRLLFGCFSTVVGLIILALYISYNGPVM